MRNWAREVEESSCDSFIVIRTIRIRFSNFWNHLYFCNPLKIPRKISWIENICMLYSRSEIYRSESSNFWILDLFASYNFLLLIITLKKHNCRLSSTALTIYSPWQPWTNMLKWGMLFGQRWTKKLICLIATSFHIRLI